jgi:hypothetical protein
LPNSNQPKAAERWWESGGSNAFMPYSYSNCRFEASFGIGLAP